MMRTEKSNVHEIHITFDTSTRKDFHSNFLFYPSLNVLIYQKNNPSLLMSFSSSSSAPSILLIISQIKMNEKNKTSKWYDENKKSKIKLEPGNARWHEWIKSNKIFLCIYAFSCVICGLFCKHIFCSPPHFFCCSFYSITSTFLCCIICTPC